MDPERRSARTITPRRHPKLRASLAAFLVSLLLASVPGSVPPLEAALEQGGVGAQALFGADDDNLDNPAIQPPGTAANQSLNNTDVLIGGFGNDVLIGLLGSDVLRGGPGKDILVGGTEQGVAPNSDIIFGESGDDISVWAPGDGSDAFIGGSGRDALVFGVIDRQNNIPTLSNPTDDFPLGVPTADVSGMNGFCRVDPVPSPEFGYDFLVRFFVRTTGNLAVTIRVRGVEQAFCGGEVAGQITFADLTQANPQFVVVSLAEVQQLNPDVWLIIR